MITYCFLVSLFLIGSDAKARNTFPADFQFGVSTAAFQIEGGWNADGKSESIWDSLGHEHPEAFVDHSNGDIACDSYHLWETDVKILKDMGVHYYRFSLSWSRILPTGFPNVINKKGIEYYNNLIDSLLKNNIVPMVTLYHWDLPQSLQDLGGWTSVETAQYFGEYARIAFENFGDRVKTWITINEPASICEDSYGNNQGAPPISSPGIGDYLCGKTILLAHANAYHIYQNEFKEKQKGQIGITIDSLWAEPKTNSTEDVEAAEREMQMVLGWWAHPIFSKQGDYPEVMKTRIANRSLEENFVESRLPPLTTQEVERLRGSADFFGLNHYTTKLISNYEYPLGTPSFQKDRGTLATEDPKWDPDSVPWGFYKLIKWVSNEYNYPLIYITENGYPDKGEIDDIKRTNFIKDFLKELLQAVEEGCQVKSYTVWSIMDNMEWRYGYTVKFGLYHVDFQSPNRTRTPKTSAKFYKKVIETKSVPDNIYSFL